MAPTVEATPVEAEATRPKELTFEITREKTYRTLGAPNASQAKTEDFLAAMARRVPSDSGLLPPGLLSVRTGGKYTQVVVQTEPAVHTVCWGEEEGSSHSVYPLAMPWRVIIAVYTENQLYGARVFYSPRQVTHLRQPLYHANVPNLNCMGYNSTGVGWLCLYQVGQHFKSLREKTLYAIDRASGGEPFNNANMSSTDGPRFYYSVLRALGKDPADFKYLWEPEAWAAKSEAEGFEWTLDDDLWVPVLVKGIDDQFAHDPKGIPLTLGGAMYGHYQTYYSDRDDDKVYNGFSRVQGYTVPKQGALFDAMSVAFSEASGTADWRVPPLEDSQLLLEGFEHPMMGVEIKMEAQPYCTVCEANVDPDTAMQYEGAWYCDNCASDELPSCAVCDELTNEPMSISSKELLAEINADEDVENVSMFAWLCGDCHSTYAKRVEKAAKKVVKKAAKKTAAATVSTN